MQKDRLIPWSIENSSKDLVTALSVWTHLKESHSTYYFKEISRVLKPGGKAIITFFFLDESYIGSIPTRTEDKGKYHSTNQKLWLFENKAYESQNWYTPKWVKDPEVAIGVNQLGVDQLLNESGLKLVKYYPGNWKEQPGVFFQDVLVFEKQ